MTEYLVPADLTCPELCGATNLVFGVPPLGRIHLANVFENAKVRLKFRPDDFVKVYVRSPDGKLFQEFALGLRPNGDYVVCVEQRRNIRN